MAKDNKSSANIATQKKWWAALWNGLIMDREAKHYQKMGNAIWIFLYLILTANRDTGYSIKKIKTITADTGIKERTIRQWLSTLRKEGYIQTHSTGRCLLIHIKKWITLPDRHRYVTQSGKSMPTRVAESCRSDDPKNSPNSFNLSQKSSSFFNPNDNTLKKDIKNVNVKEDLLIFNSCVDLDLKNKDKLLACKICKALKDDNNLALYLSYTKKYPEEIIRRAFDQVNKTPLNKIKKTKGALFTYLVKHYAKATS